MGEVTSPGHLGLLCAVEKVAEVGVLKSPGEPGRPEYALSTVLYESTEDRGSLPMTRGGGRRRLSGWNPYAEPTELTLLMLDVDSDLECPLGPPALPPVEALALLPAIWRVRSVLIWR